ncbi:uncharacterized protein LOC132702821 isoform X2 [Cylas formicarius]|uniref:uncharacterized protein LOC132702821 isoform X2 n=1 Tax=Cylas formicarius TaxID=197179 RepID=UPI002958DCC9|nr:uncharacterized protein LOC132702821 isoform X2 [Cylas formicarius]
MSRIPKFGGDRSGRAAASTSRTIPDRSSYFQHESLCDPCAPQSSTRPETYSRIGSRVRQLRTPQVTSTPLATRAQRPDGVATPLPESLAARPGRYVVPAEYGPRTVKGMGMTYSSPQSLRGQMEAALPKHLKYSTSKPPHGFMDRRALQSTQLEDLFSGSFHVYERGPPRHDPSGIPFEDPDVLEQQVDPELVAELFGMSAADVSVVEDRAETDLINMSMQDPGATVYTRGHDVQEIPQQTIRTPSGLEPILQQTYTEKRVDKQRDAEKIVRNISVVEIDETTGQAVRVTMSAQQIDPDYGLPSQGRDVTSVKETIAVTPSYTTTARDVTREVTRLTVDLDPVELERLVEEETEDVDNTLKMAPPELPLSPEKYGIKKRLRKLRMNSESMALLEQSVVNPMPTADGALSETPPEAIATILHAIESGVAPQCTPDQVFNSLFETKLPERAITLSSVGPGPLQDVVVPHELDMNVHKEAMTADLNKLTDVYRNTANIEELPYVDIFTKVMEGALDSTPGKGRTTRPFKPIMDEESPWGDEDS